MSNTATAPAALVLSADDTIAVALVATIKSAVNGAKKYAEYVEHYGITREDVKVHAAALAVLAYPNDEPVQKKNGERTRYGHAVNAAATGLRRALGKAETVEPDRLAALVKAAERAVNDGHTPEQIMAALATVLDA